MTEHHLCQKPMLLTLATFCCMLPAILWLKMRPMILLCQVMLLEHTNNLSKLSTTVTQAVTVR